MWFILEVDHETIDAIWRAAAADGGLVGNRLETAKRGGEVVIQSRERMVVGLGGIVTIRPCHLTISEAGSL